MKTIFMGIMALLLSYGILEAQVTQYAFSATMGTYTPITGGTVHGTVTNDNECFNAVPLGFNFTYNNQTYSAVSISSNGFIAMGSTVTTSNTALSTGTTNNVLAVMNRDLTSRTNGELSSLLSGEAPDRVFTIQWKNYRRYPTQCANDTLNFQIKLHESSNQIRYAYGYFKAANYAVGQTVQCGLRGNANTDFLNRTTTTDWAASTAGTTNSANMRMNALIVPANGLIYSWDMPVSEAVPYPAAVVAPADNAVNIALNTALSWQSGGGSVTGYRVYFGTDNPPTNLVNGLDQTASSYTPAAALTYSTVYHWQIVPYNSIGSAAACPVWTFTSMPNPLVTTLPFIENWDSYSTTNLPPNWTVNNANNDGYTWQINTSTPYSSPNSVRIGYNIATAIPMDDWFVSPPLQLTGGVAYKLSFRYKGTSATFTERLAVLWGTASVPAELVNSIYNNSSITNTTYSLAECLLTLPADGVYYLGWHGYSAASMAYLYVDDIRLEVFTDLPLAAQTPYPEHIITSVELNPVLTWVGGSGSFQDGYKVYLGTDNPPTNLVNGTQQTATAFASPALVANTTYYWKIVPYNSNGDAVNCPVWQFTTGNYVPPLPAQTPSPAVAANVSISSTTLSWQSGGGVAPTGYRMYIGTNNPPDNVVNGLSQGGSSFYLSPLLPNSTYYWSIVPYNDYGIASGCPVWQFTTGSFAPNPAVNPVPANNAINQSINPALSWSNGTGQAPTGYRVFLGTDNPPTNVANGIIRATATYAATGLSPTTVYYWQIVPFNAYADAAACPVWQFTTLAAIPPNPAVLTSPVDTANNISVASLLYWQTGGGVITGYKVYLGTDNPPTNVTNGSIQTATSYNPYPDLNYSTAYYWRIVPYNDFGDAAGCPVWRFTTAAEPIVISFTDINAGLPNLATSSAAWGDYNNDGLLDCALSGYILSSEINVTKIYRNNGNGNFTDINASLTGVRYSSLAWSDYDNDGYLDLAVIGTTGIAPPWTPLSKVYHNNGNGTFSDINAALTNVQSGALAWGDYDNDGDQDLLITGFDFVNPSSKLYRNDSGIFTDAAANLSNVCNSSVAWGDYDNDGDLDILLSGDTRSGFVTKIYRNDNGVMLDANIAMTGLYLSAVSWVDYDNDGDLDAFISGANTDYHSGSYITTIYRNTNGSFTNANIAFTPMFGASTSWGDYDNDGDSDLAISGGTSGNTPYNPLTKVYNNNSNGTFSNGGYTLSGLYLGTAAWGDYNNNNKLDLLISGSNNTKIYQVTGGNPNAVPVAPANLAISTSGSYTILSWDAGTDGQTPATGLSYSLRAGTTPGGSNLLSAMASSTGYRRNPVSGDSHLNRTWKIKTSVVTGLPVWYWSVQTIDGALVGSAFAPELMVSAVAPPNPAHTPVPADNALILDSNVVQLSWQMTAGVPQSGFKIYFGTDNPPTNIVNGTIQTGMTYDTSALTSNTDYYWQIVPYNVNGDAVSCPVWHFTTGSFAPPSAAQTPAPADLDIAVSKLPLLAWQAGTGSITGYRIYLGTDNPPTNLANGIIQTGNAYTPAAILNENTLYYWKIVPYNNYGDAIDCPLWQFTTGTEAYVAMANRSVAIPWGTTAYFYDSGRETGDYQAAEDYTLTFTPASVNSAVRVQFVQFTTEAGADYLSAYNGTSVTAPLLGTPASGTTPPGILTGTGASGALTFRFTSGASNQYAGWVAVVTVISNSVSVTGTVYGSDAPGIGLSNAQITLAGTATYYGTSNAAGEFSISGVHIGYTYQYTITKSGYQSAIGNVTIGTEDYSMGGLTLSEAATSVSSVTVSQNALQSAVDIIWSAGSAANRTQNQDEQEAASNSRSLTGYRIWRLPLGQEANESAWTLLNTDLITATAYTDTVWQYLNNGYYKWAVKAVYSNNVVSVSTLSTALQKTNPIAYLAGTVLNELNLPVNAATITAGIYTTTSGINGTYSLQIAAGTYSVICSATGYTPSTQTGVYAPGYQITTLDFRLLEIPHAPVNLQAVIRQYNTVILTWASSASRIALPETGNSRSLMGYNVLRDGVAVNASPVTQLTYQDYPVPTGAHTYSVVALYTSQTSDPSNLVSLTIDPIPAALTLPFAENWESTAMSTNKWYADANWSAFNTNSTPGYVARFNFEPLQYEYSSELVSWDIDALSQSTVRMAYDVCLHNYESNGLEVLAVEVMTGGVWREVDRIVNDTAGNADIDWTHRNLDISAYVRNSSFRLRFNAHGLSSFYIDSWQVDNISVYVPDPVAIVISPQQWSYGEVRLSQSVQQEFTISNSSANPYVITNIWLEGADTADFILTCPTLPISTDQPCTFQVAFAPLTLGTKQVTVKIGDSQTRVIQEILLSGTATPAELNAPETVTCTQAAGMLTLSWSPVPFATAYIVYSSAAPEGTYTEETGGTYLGTSWMAALSGTTRFYKVTAVYSAAGVLRRN